MQVENGEAFTMDANGRKYLKLSELRWHSAVMTDDMFSTCGIGECICIVCWDWKRWLKLKWQALTGKDTRLESAFFIWCDGGEENGHRDCRHFLDGAIEDEEGTLIGIYQPTMDELLRFPSDKALTADDFIARNSLADQDDTMADEYDRRADDFDHLADEADRRADERDSI